MSHGPVPLLLLMLFGLCLTLPGLYLRTAGLLALNALSVYTGFGILLGLITPFLIAIEAGRRAVDGRECVPFLALCVVVAVATLAAFMVGYRYTTAVACFEFPHPRPWEYFPYAALMLSLPFGWLGKTKISVLLGLGTLATLLALVVTAARRAGSRDASGTSSAVLLTFAGFTTLFVANATVGRICQGVETSQASRYVLYVVPGLFAIYLALRPGGGWSRRLATVAFAALLITGELRVHAQYRGLLRGFCGGKARWRACYLQRADICLRSSDPFHRAPLAPSSRPRLEAGLLEAQAVESLQRVGNVTIEGSRPERDGGGIGAPRDALESRPHTR